MARPKGSRNKRTEEFYAAIEKSKFNIPKAYLWAYKEAKKNYTEYAEMFRDKRLSPMEDNRPKLLGIMINILKDISSHVYPKIKAIEIVNMDLLQGMTPAQRLEAMKAAVQKLELEIKDGPSSV